MDTTYESLDEKQVAQVMDRNQKKSVVESKLNLDKKTQRTL